MATVTINGVTYCGNNIEIRGGRVVIDGAEQDKGVQGVVEIRVLQGVINHLTTDASVSCGEVQGDVSAGGSVNCDDVLGDVVAGGSVNCGDVAGDVTAGGSILKG